MISPKMNTERMPIFLSRVSAAHPEDFIVMVLTAQVHTKGYSATGKHQACGAALYAPELNPQEHVWDEVREKEFPNRVLMILPR